MEEYRGGQTHNDRRRWTYLWPRRHVPEAVGTAKDVADEMAEIVTSGADDGFVVSPAFLPDTFEDFVADVVPILQEKGLFRSEYEGRTLRDRLGFSAVHGYP
jgi:alkanesulfonate monooxygenase SsuD/methylene tetrahydromethanopterin reductase-like flavin-dependent oxidoreductase (luciferase family)